jgi:hypothetical protein
MKRVKHPAGIEAMNFGNEFFRGARSSNTRRFVNRLASQGAALQGCGSWPRMNRSLPASAIEASSRLSSRAPSGAMGKVFCHRGALERMVYRRILPGKQSGVPRCEVCLLPGIWSFCGLHIHGNVRE